MTALAVLLPFAIVREGERERERERGGEREREREEEGEKEEIKRNKDIQDRLTCCFASSMPSETFFKLSLDIFTILMMIIIVTILTC